MEGSLYGSAQAMSKNTVCFFLSSHTSVRLPYRLLSAYARFLGFRLSRMLFAGILSLRLFRYRRQYRVIFHALDHFENFQASRLLSSPRNACRIQGKAFAISFDCF